MVKFHESDFYREYKYIRNQFRKYDSIDLLVESFRFLYKKYPTQIDEISKKQPWQVLLLIKWILIDDEFRLPSKNNLTEGDYLKILQAVRDLGGKVRMPPDYEHHHLLFRNISYQQLIYQRHFNTNAFTRQVILFTELNDNHYIKTTFRNEIGIEVNKFIELSIILLTRFNKGIRPLKLEWFSSLFYHYGKDSISTFLNSISLTLAEARDYLIKESDSRRRSSEYYEQTPLIRYPLLKINEKYYPYNLNILYRGLEYFIYDSVREVEPSNFMNKFGSIFEDYIRKNLNYANIDFKDENYLANEVGESSKVVDFLIQEEEKSILIDAKGVEMNYLGKVSHRPDTVLQKVKSSAVKGVKQAYELIYNLQNKNSELISQKNENNYLLIVTYKDLYLGSGQDFKESIASDFVEKLVSSYRDEYLVPLKNIYFIPIDAFELWIEMIKKDEITLGEGLERAISDDQKPKTRKFDFIQHVTSWSVKNELPEFLKEEFESIFDKIIELYENR